MFNEVTSVIECRREMEFEKWAKMGNKREKSFFDEKQEQQAKNSKNRKKLIITRNTETRLRRDNTSARRDFGKC